MTRYVIVGNSAAGLSAAQAIREMDRHSQVTILSEEGSWAYARVSLSWLVEGTISHESLFFRRADFYDRWGILLETEQQVVQVLPDERVVHTAAGCTYPYDRLLIATGSRARPLNVPGAGLDGVHVLRSLTDAEALRARIENSRSALVIGGGLVGIKSAEALLRRGVHVQIVVSSRRVLSQVLNAEVADVMADRLRAAGIVVKYGVDVERFDGVRGQLQSARLSDGTWVPCEVAIVAKGVMPNRELVEQTGITTKRGIVVDPAQRTSIPHVYAAGDVAESFDLAMGASDVCPNWPTALRQGRVAGTNMAGGAATYPGNLRANVAAIEGLSFGSVGDVGGQDGVDVYSRGPDKHGRGCWLYVRDRHLIGAVLSGDIAGLHCLEWLIRQQQPLHVPVERLLSQPQHYVMYAHRREATTRE